MITLDLGTFDYLTEVRPVRRGSRAERVIAQARCHTCDWSTQWSGYGADVIAAALRHHAHAHNPRKRAG